MGISVAYEFRVFSPKGSLRFFKRYIGYWQSVVLGQENFPKTFFLRVADISAHRWEEFYRHHLGYYLEKHPQGNEETFFKVLWQLVETRLKSLMAKDIYASKSHERDQKEIQQLESFAAFLVSIDQWNGHKTEREMVVRLQKELFETLNLVETLKAELKSAKNLEPSDHINIPKGYALTLADIFIELLLFFSGKY